MNKALFLDLDGTLIKTKSGETFPKDKDDWMFNENILEVIKDHVQKSNIPVIVVTNQGGIQEGYVKVKDFDDKMNKIIDQIMGSIGIAPKILCCGINDTDHYYRKPNPGMAYNAAIEFQLDLSKSVMVGDASGLEGQFSNSDKMFAKNSGIGTYYDISEFLK